MEQEESIRWYQRALQQLSSNDSLAAAVQAAGYWTQLGSIQKQMRDFDAALDSWQRAHARYSDCRARVLRTEARKGPWNKQICLDALIAETVHARATLLQWQNDYLAAMDLLEQLVPHLRLRNLHRTVVDGISFVPLDDSKEWLLKTLEALGRWRLSAGEYAESQALFEEALIVSQHNDRLRIKVLLGLAELYLRGGQVDRSLATLARATDLQTSLEMLWSFEAMALMDRIGMAYEDAEDWEQAQACFEQALLARNVAYGKQHLEVARSLIHMARVMERQGNPDGSLDLYKAAKAIYATQVTALEFDENDAQAILEVVPVLIRQERYEEAVGYLNKCISAVEEDSKTLDQSKIYFWLGKAYAGLGNYVSATVCLLEAAKHPGTIQQEEVFAMLQRVEFLQRDRSLQSHTSDDDSQSTDSNGSDSDELSMFLQGRSAAELLDDDLCVVTRSPTIEGVHGSKKPGNPLRQLSTPVTADIASLSCSKSSIESTSSDGVRNSMPSPRSSAPLNKVMDEIQLNLSVDSLDKDSLLVSDNSQTSSRLTSSVSDTPVNKPEANKPRRRGFRMALSSPRRPRRTNMHRRLLSPRKALASAVDAPETDDDAPDAPDSAEVDEIEEQYHTSMDNPFSGPIQFVALPTTSFDDGVSQITMMIDENGAQRYRGQEWWWGVTAEGFGRWFPSTYISQAVEAAEGFLSSKAIHDKAKSAPLHVDMDGTDNPGSGENSLGEGIEVTHIDDGKGGAMATIEEGKTNSARQSKTRQSSKSEADKKKAMEIRQKRNELEKLRADLGPSHPRVGQVYMELAGVYKSARRMKDAIEATEVALSIFKTHENDKVCDSCHHMLGELSLHDAQHDKALAHYSAALRIERRLFGHSHTTVANTLNCLGAARALKNEFSLAMKCHREALHILKQCNRKGLKDPLVTQTLCQIGSVYYRERNAPSSSVKQKEDYSTFIEAGMLEVIGRAHEDRGSYKMAIAFFEEKLQFMEDGSSNTEELIATLNSLGMLSSRAGVYTEALEYYERALKLQRSSGCSRAQIATANVLIGIVVYQLGDWDKALKMLNSSLETLLMEYGTENETVAATWYQIGVVQLSNGRSDAGAAALHKALELQTRLLGLEHPATLRTRRELGSLQFRTNELGAVWKVQRQIHGERHPNVAETLYCMGAACADPVKALSYLEDCYYMRLEFLGVDHPLQATTLMEIAKIHLKRGRIHKASQLVTIILSIWRESLSDQHPDLARALSLQGSCYAALGDWTASIKSFAEAESIRSIGPHHRAEILVARGMLRLRMCQFEEARQSIEEALELYQRAGMREDDRQVKEARKNLEKVERDELLCV